MGYTIVATGPCRRLRTLAGLLLDAIVSTRLRLVDRAHLFRSGVSEMILAWRGAHSDKCQGMPRQLTLALGDTQPKQLNQI